MSAEAFLGPLEIGALLSTIMSGVTCLQSYLYFVDHSTNDSIALKCLVAVLIILEITDTTSICHMLYFYSVASFDEIEKFTTVLWSSGVQRFVSSFACNITQCFFAIRVYYLNGHHLCMPVLIVLASACSSIAVIGIAIGGFIMPKPFTHEQIILFSRLGSVRTLVSLFSDVMITTCTIFHLLKTRRQTIGADQAIYKLIKYTLNTGLLITIFALATSIVYFVQQEVFTYAPYDFILTRLYACSVISILNSRAAVQKEIGNIGRSMGPGDDIFTSVAVEPTVIRTIDDHA